MILPGGDGISFMMLSAVTDLPQPDSPTTPRVSPFSMYRSTPSTARTMPSSVKKYVLRFLTSNRRSAIWCGLPLPGLRNLAERVEGAVDVLPVHVLVGHAPDGAGPDLVDLDLAGQAAGQARRVGVVLGEPVDHAFERNQPGRGEDAHLAHPAAQHLPRAARARHELARAADERADRRRQALGQAEGDRVDGPREVGDRPAERHRGVEDARAVEMHGNAVGVRDRKS